MSQIRKKQIAIGVEDFKRITENKKYKDTIINHASGKSNIEKRFEYVYKELSKID